MSDIKTLLAQHVEHIDVIHNIDVSMFPEDYWIELTDFISRVTAYADSQEAELQEALRKQREACARAYGKDGDPFTKNVWEVMEIIRSASIDK